MKFEIESSASIGVEIKTSHKHLPIAFAPRRAFPFELPIRD